MQPIFRFLKGSFYLAFLLFTLSVHAKGIKCEQLGYQIGIMSSASYSFRNPELLKQIPVYATGNSEIDNFVVHHIKKAAKTWIQNANNNFFTKLLAAEEKEVEDTYLKLLKINFNADSCDSLHTLKTFYLRSIDRTLRLLQEIETEIKERPLSDELPYFYTAQTMSKSALDEAALKDSLRSFSLTAQRSLSDLIRMGGRAKHLIVNESNEQLLKRVLDAYAISIDPHTTHFSLEEWERFQDRLRERRQAGIGIHLEGEVASEFPLVASLIKDGPAHLLMEQAKTQGLPYLQRNDEITDVSQNGRDYSPVNEMSTDEVSALLRGDSGTTVYLKVKRNGQALNAAVELKRARLSILENLFVNDIYIQKDSEGRERKIGVLRFQSFGEFTAGQIINAIKSLKQRGAEAIILDLRNNGGGYLHSATELGDAFIAKGTIAQVKRVDGQVIRYPAISNPRIEYSGPLVIAINQSSASASEILAGAMQDWGRALVVGTTRSYGKGSVQDTFTKENHPEISGALKVTTSIFYLPSGRSTQFKGVPAQIVVPTRRFDLINRAYERGESAHGNALRVADIAPDLNLSEGQGEGASAWSPITPQLIEELKQKAAARLAKDSQAQRVLDYNQRGIAATKNKNLTVREYLGLVAEAKKVFPDDEIDPKQEVIDTQNAAAYQPATRVDDREILSVTADLAASLSRP